MVRRPPFPSGQDTLDRGEGAFTRLLEGPPVSGLVPIPFKPSAPVPIQEAMDREVSPGAKRIRVLIVDDHSMIRQVLRLACESRPGIEVVGEAGTGDEALDLANSLAPDVMVLDLTLPGMSGLEVARRLRAEGSAVKILVLTASDDKSDAFQALRVGVHGYVEKSAPIHEVAAAIEAIDSGLTVYSAQSERMAHERLGEFARKARESARAIAALTPREREVLSLIAEGYSTRQIATRLKLSERTAETHISNIYNKLGVRTRVQALYRAAGMGLVDLD
jgi:DNA-binding NarL/FixJ family response regulator